MRFLQDIVAATVLLVLVYLVLANWRGSNTLLATTFSGYIGSVRTLQGR